MLDVYFSEVRRLEYCFKETITSVQFDLLSYSSDLFKELID